VETRRKLIWVVFSLIILIFTRNLLKGYVGDPLMHCNHGVVDLTGGRSPTLPFVHPRLIAKLLASV
jgi:hypothetical protein